MPSTNVMPSTITILPLTGETVDAWVDANTATRGEGDIQRLSRLWDDMRNGTRMILAAWHNTLFLGHITIQESSEYTPFRVKKIPEIVDLWVQPELRRRGVAKQLLQAAEDYARKNHAAALGLGVGVTSEYGAAHRLYAFHNYLPDGSGLWAQSRQTKNGDKIVVDDTALYMLVKTL